MAFGLVLGLQNQGERLLKPKPGNAGVALEDQAGAEPSEMGAWSSKDSTVFRLPQTPAFSPPPTRKSATRPGLLPKASQWAPTTTHLALGFWSVCSAAAQVVVWLRSAPACGGCILRPCWWHCPFAESILHRDEFY